MAVIKGMRRAIRSLFGSPSSLPASAEGESLAYRDTLSAINDLSRLVRNDPEAVDIYLALGNLFRAQGDIERAVMIRERLNARPGLNTKFKARSYFELGQDYLRAGVVDRSLEAFRKAARLGYPEEAVTMELAELFAQAGDFPHAAEEYGRLKRYLAQAHYLVRQAEELSANGQKETAGKLLKRALRSYPASIEAWSAMICMAAMAGDWRNVSSFLEKALAKVAASQRFLLLDALLETESLFRSGTRKEHNPAPFQTFSQPASSKAAEEAGQKFALALCAAVIPVLEKQEPQILLNYYGALLLERASDLGAVEIWLAKALVVQPDFWAARLLSLSIAGKKQDLPPVVALQIGYFTEELKHIRRFVCTVCGFRENRVFYRCRRCGSWHSLSFRLSLQE